MVSARSNDAAALKDISPVLDVLREQLRVDLRQYKRSMLQRRIMRRILLHELDGVGSYVKLLAERPEELEALYHDVLTNVTSFFRDPQTFEALATAVFPAITAGRLPDDAVRMWTLGCSTGEEAYSLAIAFTEFVEAEGRVIPFTLYATDVNAVSVDRARHATYNPGALQNVSPERLKRFFVEADGQFKVVKSIAGSCVFARHDACIDPPLRRMDLVTCRNMLIYLEPELQERAIASIDEALNDNAFLCLGRAETLGGHAQGFELTDARANVYRKMRAAEHAQPSSSGAESWRELERLRHDQPVTRELVQSLIDHHATANEQLQAANAEIQAANDELRNLNEQIATSAKHVEANNGALARLNAGLHARNVQLMQTNDDLTSVLVATDCAAVAVGPDLRIRYLTPAAEKLLSARAGGDVGRALSEIDQASGVSDVDSLVREVIDLGVKRECEVQHRDGPRLLVRIARLPADEHRSAGALLVLTRSERPGQR